MNIQTVPDLDQKARSILTENDHGTYTVPTKGLYPFQWNWDSALVALGICEFDLERAWVEIETLLSAQWDNGMVPHIIFWQNDEGYFPGPAEWGTKHSPPTSGITQPPVAATILRHLLERSGKQYHDRARAAIKALNRWHDWFCVARDPESRGLVAIIHPWESGRDNLPDWDEPLSYVDISAVGSYQRRDTQHIEADQRPQKIDYDRYMALVQFGRKHHWNDREIAKNNPFWVADVGMNAILRRAERDLAHMAGELGEAEIANSAGKRANRLDQGFEALWSDRLGGYVSLDLRRDKQAPFLTAGTFLAFFATDQTQPHTGQMLDMLKLWNDKVSYGVPSFDPRHPLFDAIRYWRGPIWAIINWMIADGLYRNGHLDEAAHIRNDTKSLIMDKGFFEYFCPLTGRGGGGNAFSWTAAIWLAWASPSQQKGSSPSQPSQQKLASPSQHNQT